MEYINTMEFFTGGFFFFFRIGVLLMCMFVHHKEARKGCQIPGTRVYIDSCDLPCGCRELGN